ncbi:hypothetical protein CA850_11895 [Micromonospora echinospora]|uniref:Uncharacterized protein n=1 Tax=Micromonospora echinospora TaxID=1877 RepID=A0A1C4UDN5_MICEC|nr:hypothetical protein [Micromonospora echinospora]OZV80866.1 hypothetical protein CA850_11895 [Micromonospora echinospora]SCE69810.1 hypothetical protein GA0070618_0240 [Micromonospora echinospora]
MSGLTRSGVSVSALTRSGVSVSGPIRGGVSVSALTRAVSPSRPDPERPVRPRAAEPTPDAW